MARLRTSALAASVVALALASGCPQSSEDAGPPAGRAPAGSQPNQTGGDSTTANVEIEVINEEDLQQILDQNQGKVVLLDFWGTWCAPCLELLPHTIELQQRYGDRGLVVIPIAIDVEDTKPELEDVLLDNGYSGTAYLSEYGISEQSITSFEIATGALPYLRIHSPDGTVAAELYSDRQPLEPADIEAAVEAALP